MYYYFWQSDSYLSQWKLTRFAGMAGVEYNCAEQYMMAQKARLFGDYDTADLIMQAKSPKEQKALGRQVRGFNADTWKECCDSIVFQGNFYKFTQNANAYKELMSTGTLKIVEASPYDGIWGIGLSEEDARKTDPQKWGQNKLGYILTKLRDGFLNVRWLGGCDK